MWCGRERVGSTPFARAPNARPREQGRLASSLRDVITVARFAADRNDPFVPAVDLELDPGVALNAVCALAISSAPHQREHGIQLLIT
jgi:hypothetical protein